mgnify:CR=1 FL=1
MPPPCCHFLLRRASLYTTKVLSAGISVVPALAPRLEALLEGRACESPVADLDKAHAQFFLYFRFY